MVQTTLLGGRMLVSRLCLWFCFWFRGGCKDHDGKVVVIEDTTQVIEMTRDTWINPLHHHQSLGEGVVWNQLEGQTLSPWVLSQKHQSKRRRSHSLKGRGHSLLLNLKLSLNLLPLLWQCLPWWVHWRARKVSLSRRRHSKFSPAALHVGFHIPPRFSSPTILWRHCWLHIRRPTESAVEIQDGLSFETSFASYIPLLGLLLYASSFIKYEKV